EVRERVLDGVERLWLQPCFSQTMHGVLAGLGIRLEFGQAPQPAPDTALRPPLQQHAALAVHGDQHENVAHLALARAPWRRNLQLPSGVACVAALGEWAHIAERLTPHADRRAEIHDRLRVHLDALMRRAALRELPEPVEVRTLGEIALHAEESRQH